MKLVDFLRPLMRSSPRQSIRLLGMLGAGYSADGAWADVQPRYRSYFDYQLQALVTADLSEWGGRSCFYWGRFYDVAHQALLRRFLRNGDTYIDIGANLGFQTLFARNLVGPQGTIISFEPNPTTYALLTSHIGINRVWNCRTFNMALGDQPGEAALNLTENHSGTATLRQDVSAIRSVTVPVMRGDDVLGPMTLAGRVVLKIDVEGFELKVLRGLRQTLERVSMASVEITPEWISQQGGTAEDLYRLMRDLGFLPYIAQPEWRFGLFESDLRIIPATGIIPEQHDGCFVRENLAHEMGLATPRG